MNSTMRISAFALAASVVVGISASAPAQQANMTFFVTSAGSGKGADLGGLAGADRICQSLAQAAGAGGHTWHAYLSTQAADGQPAVNARDRAELVALRRLGTVEDCARVVEFLATDLSDYVTGAVIPIDGGLRRG